MIRLLLLSMIFAACGTDSPGPQPPHDARPAALDSLERQIEVIASQIDGTVGVGVAHAKTGARASLNGTDRFPMASAYKLPIALKVMHDARQGDLHLDSVVTITPSEAGPYYSPLMDASGDAGVSVSLDSLLALMLGLSDNTASDVLLRLAGGPQAVTTYLHERGFGGIRVDRSEREMALATSGVGAMPPGAVWSRAAFERRAAAVPEAERQAAQARYAADPQDTATPEAMADLLIALHRGEFGFDAAQQQRLLSIMTESPTGADRIRGLLPPGTRVAHKTGTAWGSLNDAGLITLPGEGGTVAVVVFIKGSAQPDSVRERVIAEIARAVFDHFAAPR